MAQQIKKIIKKAVRVVYPASVASPTPSAPLGVRAEEPVLGHRPGIDKVVYGSADFAACRDASNYTVRVDGREHKVFFFCGHPRSGTHWMDAVLKLHPKVWIDGEYRFESMHNSLIDLTGKFWHAGSR